MDRIEFRKLVWKIKDFTRNNLAATRVVENHLKLNPGGEEVEL